MQTTAEEAESTPGEGAELAAEALRLRNIAEELTTIAAALAPARPEPVTVSEPAEIETDLGAYARLTPEELSQMVNIARQMYRNRRLRPRIFADEALFGEPAWDILLDLFIAEADNKPLSVTAACIGAAVPTSTALRWLAILEERGLLRRENDPGDARRVFLHLTEDGHAKMTSFLLQVHRENTLGN